MVALDEAEGVGEFVGVTEGIGERVEEVEGEGVGVTVVGMGDGVTVVGTGEGEGERLVEGVNEVLGVWVTVLVSVGPATHNKTRRETRTLRTKSLFMV